MRWIDSIKEAIGVSLQDLSRAVEDRTWWTSLIHSVHGVRVDSTASNTHISQKQEKYRTKFTHQKSL